MYCSSLRHRRAFLILVACLISVSAFPQGKDDFPAVTKEDLEMTVYEPDPTAVAVMLYNQGASIMDAVSTQTRRYVRIKFFKASAFNQWANVKLFTDKRVGGISATTYSLDKKTGQIIVTPMPEDAIMRRPVNRYIDEANFTLSNVSEGCIIEYSFLIRYNGLGAPNWTFQYSIPVKYSEYLLARTDIPVNFNLLGPIQEVRHEERYRKIYDRWVLRTIPALKLEPMMPDEKVFCSQLVFTDARAQWYQVIDALYNYEDVWGAVRKNMFLQKVATELTAGLKTEQEKIKAISHYVKETVSWNGARDYYAEDFKKVIERRKGSSGDINLLMASLLRKAGLNVALVFISTVDNGYIHLTSPSISQFNYALCMVQGRDSILLDATEKHLPYDVLPKRCLNYDGLVLSDTFQGWITFGATQKDQIAVTANFDLKESGELQGFLSFNHVGYAAFDERTAQITKKESGEKPALLSHLNIEIESTEETDLDAYDKPFKQKFTGRIHDQALVNDDHIYLNPVVAMKPLAELATESRAYPVDFGVPLEWTYVGFIKIPAGYVVDELPASKIFSLPANSGKFTYSIQQSNGQIVVTTKFQQSRIIFKPQEYGDLREFYSRVTAKNAEQVVLKKVK